MHLNFNLNPITTMPAYRILLVEDNDYLRTALTKMLEQAGYIVSEAENGEVALDILALGHFDLVVTDLLMPEKEGIETITAIRRQSPGMPIIAISGGGCLEPQAYLEAAVEFGADMALAKPFGKEPFLEAIAKTIESHLPKAAGAN